MSENGTSVLRPEHLPSTAPTVDEMTLELSHALHLPAQGALRGNQQRAELRWKSPTVIGADTGKDIKTGRG